MPWSDRSQQVSAQVLERPFDAGPLHALTDNDPALLIRLIDTIQRSCAQDRAALLKLDGRSTVALASIAHRQLGGARMIGAHEVACVCEALQDLSHAGSARRALELRDALIEQLERLENAMDELRGQVNRARLARRTQGP